MIKKLKNLELNFSNICTGRCFICSKSHGSGCSEMLMPVSIFNIIENQIKDIEIERIDTSGCGDCFLNSNYINYLKRLNKIKPHSQIMCYSNFALFDKYYANEIIEKNLFNRIHVRIDSLNKNIFEKSSNLNQERVFNNLKYFLQNNKNITVRILYANMRDYYNQCVKVLRQEPYYLPFTKSEINFIDNEMKEIKEYFKPYDRVGKLEVIKLGFSLWGERIHCKSRPDLRCKRINQLKEIIWIHPNGNTSCCPYDDTQDVFDCGSILKENIWDIFTGEKRKKWLRKIESGEISGKKPCYNPETCIFRNEK